MGLGGMYQKKNYQNRQSTRPHSLFYYVDLYIRSKNSSYLLWASPRSFFPDNTHMDKNNQRVYNRTSGKYFARFFFSTRCGEQIHTLWYSLQCRPATSATRKKIVFVVLHIKLTKKKSEKKGTVQISTHKSKEGRTHNLFSVQIRPRAQRFSVIFAV